MNQKLFSFRFDIDSLTDIEVGVPRLIEIAGTLDVRFTFFVNMGRSFNWSTVLSRQHPGARNSVSAARTINKLGLGRLLRTVILNPHIGFSHKKMLFRLLDNGHELGLHGGMDHPVWQWGLDNLSKVEIDDLLKPAYDHFVQLFGKPKGFASPGFRYNDFVLELMDDYGFEYASDMQGERPFVPENFRHLQIPVNIVGPGHKPFIEAMLASGLRSEEVVKKCKAEVDAVIEKNDIAVIYGHPAFEGKFDGLMALFDLIKVEGYQVVPMMEIVEKRSCLKRGKSHNG